MGAPHAFRWSKQLFSSGVNQLLGVNQRLRVTPKSWQAPFIICFFVIFLRQQRIKNIESSHLCYIYLANFTSPQDLSPGSQNFVRLSLCKRSVQK